MALIALLICLGLQRYLKLHSHAYQYNWVEPYYHWMESKIEQVVQGHGLVGVAILVLPVMIVVSLVFALMYHLLGWMGYFVLNLAFLWYCMDYRDFKEDPEASKKKPAELFVASYQRLFGVIFWFFIFGPVGLALYFSVMCLREYLERVQHEEAKALLAFTIKTQGVLDWVPLRLIGLSYALVGHFAGVFKLWMKELFSGIKDTQNQAAEWGMAALQAYEKRQASQAESAAASSLQNLYNEAVTLIERSLLLWLVLVALFTIGFWLG